MLRLPSSSGELTPRRSGRACSGTQRAMLAECQAATEGGEHNAEVLAAGIPLDVPMGIPL